jgi:hypothetical protein
MTHGTLRGAVAAGLAVALATGLVLAVLVVSAWAGEYHVYSCRTPTGQVAPTVGWSESEHPSYDPTLNTCASGGGLIAALDAGDAHAPNSETDQATWAFKAPEGETIAGATLWRAGNIAGGGDEEASYLFWLSWGAALGANVHVFDQCIAGKGCVSVGSLVSPLAPENRVVTPSYALDTQYLSLSTYCGSTIKSICPAGAGNSQGYEAEVELFAADITLSQPTGPTVSAVSGGLAEDPTVNGTSDVAFHATDPGSGVYEAIVEVDGKVLQHEVIDEDGGRCHNVGGTTDGLPAFLYPQPCPAVASADIPFDTTALANGEHHLVVSVTDAAGNAATVLDREIDVANPVFLSPPAPAVCQAGAAASGEGAGHPVLSAGWKDHKGARLRARYDGPAHVIEGTLTGHPDAPLEVCELPNYRGAPTTLLAAPHTAANGHWSLALPRNLSSTTLRISYRQSPAEAQPAALQTLTLTVPAPLHLQIAPRTAPSRRLMDRVPRDPHPSGRALHLPLPLPPPRPGSLPVPRALRSGGRLPVRCGGLQCSWGFRGVSAGLVRNVVGSWPKEVPMHVTCFFVYDPSVWSG